MNAKSFSVALMTLMLAAVLPAAPSTAGTCPGANVTISSASPAERELICTGARQALDLLGRCSVSPRRSIEVRVLREVRHPLTGVIFGYYDLHGAYIALTDLGGLPALMRDTPYEGLPHTDFYKSLVVHEVVHSVMHQNLRRPAGNQAAYEYPAYALQIASLPAHVRTRFLQAFDAEHIRRPIPFSDVILAFAPYVFAARAYEHFTSSVDGCGSLRALVTGESEVIPIP